MNPPRAQPNDLGAPAAAIARYAPRCSTMERPHLSISVPHARHDQPPHNACRKDVGSRVVGCARPH